MACDITIAQLQSCASGIGKLQDSIKLLQIIAQLMCEVQGGGGGGSGQIKIYIADPNSEGVVPDDMASPGIAYDDTGTLSTYVWSVIQQQWV